VKELTIAATVFGAIFGGPFTALAFFVLGLVTGAVARRVGVA
jgi:hypothetical protein